VMEGSGKTEPAGSGLRTRKRQDNIINTKFSLT